MKISRNWAVGGILGGIAAVTFLVGMARYAFPGESARLMAVWNGLTTASTDVQYPFMALFGRLFGGSNAISVVCGVVAVVALFHLITAYVAASMPENADEKVRAKVSKIAGAVAAVVFMFTPAVRSAAGHLEPRMFDFTWALLGFVVAFPFLRFALPMALLDLVVGIMVALGLCDSALFVALLPVYVIFISRVAKHRGANHLVHPLLFLMFAFFAMLIAMAVFQVGFGEFLRRLAKGMKFYSSLPGWVLVLVFATIPFFASLLAVGKSMKAMPRPTVVQIFFHTAMTVAVIIAIATPLSPSALMEKYGYLPVVASAYAAAVAGYLAAYWWHYRGMVISVVFGGLLIFVLGVTTIWNLFMFDADDGEFADRVARKIINDLGERKWFVSNGLLDDHLLIAANRLGRQIHVISLSRDADREYAEDLARIVEQEKLGGSKNAELRLSLSLGVMPFVQDYLAADPTAAKEMAIFGSPDLWQSAGIKSVPEFLFFGADPSRTPNWKDSWQELSSALHAPKGWGSYRAEKTKSPVERLRLSLRRHLGLVANNRGVYLQDAGKNDEAWKMYELVLGDIDRDNICALFNEVEMIGEKHPSAVSKRRDLERAVKAAVKDTNRRYILWQLSNYYGYVRNPDAFVRLGYVWAKSGRPGEALGQIRRAIDYLPADRKGSLLNMMASLYINEQEHAKSRRIYEAMLASKPSDHDALMGMMRLEMGAGNVAKAQEYLERAAVASADGKNSGAAKVEQAMVSMMKGEIAEAKKLFREAIDAQPKNMQAWSLLSAAVMQEIDAEKDAAKRRSLENSLEKEILPTMEKVAEDKHDYYIETIRGFLMLRKGEKRREEARAAFLAAARARPDHLPAQDMVLGIDMSMNDRQGAEEHAREVLRRNRKAPLANYVMGSLALSNGKTDEAEMFLRRAADVSEPIPTALNDLAELLRRKQQFSDAERYAREAVRYAPKLYVAWETLGSVLMDGGRSLDEAEAAIKKACELSKANGGEGDVRMFISLARVQIKRGDMNHAKVSLRKVQSKLAELNEFERGEYEKVKGLVK